MPVTQRRILENETGQWSGSVEDMTPQGGVTSRTVKITIKTGTFGKIADAKTVLQQILTALDAALGVMGGE